MTVPIFFANATAFRRWLDVHAADATELLVGFHKVGSRSRVITWSESVDEALCVGWIDGVRKRIDDATYTIRFTPRKRDSIWSAINIAKVQRLEAEGRMTPAGTRAFALRTDARSKVYCHEREQDAELSAAEMRQFKRNARAWMFFETTPPSYQRVMLHWITSAKKAETRAARLRKLIDASAAAERVE